ncbi:MAG: sulfite exporter TauE/SafE family protein [Rhabdochlamydiaceae bacterium]|nr:sulfite exporter TauE/SafE family protein [Rhabdochlamydiaceae bacterium]
MYTFFPCYLLIGVISGTLGALLGIGGGTITVPALLLLFSWEAFPEQHMMHMAIGTSLAAMVVNTFSATYFHNKKRSVDWKIAHKSLLGILLGCFIGAGIAKGLPSDLLKTFFGFFACFIGITFIKSARVSPRQNSLPSYGIWTLISGGISTLSNLLGIGGGFLMVPSLLYFHTPEKRAIGTSCATSCLISLGGAIGYFLASRSQECISGCLGYIYLPAFLLISFGSLFASFYGVKLAHSIPSKLLRKIFATTMIGIGLLMVLT